MNECNVLSGLFVSIGMKPANYLLLALLVLCSCNHQYDNPLDGAWKLTEILDKNTGTITNPPDRDDNGIFLYFSDTGFGGKTFNNVLSGGAYTVTANNGITFDNYIMTQVVEDEWGSPFLTVLSSCQLQSVAPCLPSTYKIEGRTLTIRSMMRYDIKLRRQ